MSDALRAVDLSHILFPRRLYADSRSVRSAMQKWARRAWKSGTWDCDDLDLVPLQDFPGRIVVRRAMFGVGQLQNEPHWRVYWACRLPELLKGWDGNSATGRELALINGGFEHLWFTMGWISFEYLGFNLQAEVGNACYVHLLNAFVRWLPEIAQLAGHCTGEWVPSDHRLNFLSNSLGILQAFCNNGYTLPEWQDEMDLSWQDELVRVGLVEWLLAKRFILQDGTRFRLAPKPS